MKKGFTLMELIIVIALFSVVVTVGMSFLIGSKENFNRSEEASEIHYQVRIASDYIRDEIRNATEIDIVPIPITPDNTYNYLYVQNGILYHMSLNVASEKSLNILIDNAQMFSLSQSENGHNAVNYTITATVDSGVGIRNYETPTAVNLNNIYQKLGVTGGTYAPIIDQCIQYKKPN